MCVCVCVCVRDFLCILMFSAVFTFCFSFLLFVRALLFPYLVCLLPCYFRFCNLICLSSSLLLYLCYFVLFLFICFLYIFITCV